MLVGPDLLLTNQHVLDSAELLEDARARFDYSLDEAGVAAAGRVFRFKKDFYHASPSEKYDYALVKLEAAPLAALAPPPEAAEATMMTLMRAGKHRGYLSLAPRFIKDKDRVNVIQHPDGQPMKVVMTQNYVAGDMTDTRVHYVADTMEGSSGSPVFNRNWEIVALHHSGTSVSAGRRRRRGQASLEGQVPRERRRADARDSRGLQGEGTRYDTCRSSESRTVGIAHQRHARQQIDAAIWSLSLPRASRPRGVRSAARGRHLPA